MRLWFGKFNGKKMEDVPRDYVQWLARNAYRDFLRAAAEQELERRNTEAREHGEQHEQNRQFRPEAGDLLIVKEIIESGYRSIALKNHPDRGGNTERMQKINLTMEKLRSQLE